jgi:hypothetical protein
VLAAMKLQAMKLGLYLRNMGMQSSRPTVEFAKGLFTAKSEACL